MVHLTATGIEDNRFPIVFTLLPSNLLKEGGERVIIVHRPSVKRMIVALSTLNSHPHEDLGHVFADLQDVRLNLIEIGRRIFECPAAGTKNAAYHFVERHIFRDLLAQPRIIQCDRLRTCLIR